MAVAFATWCEDAGICLHSWHLDGGTAVQRDAQGQQISGFSLEWGVDLRFSMRWHRGL